MSSSKAEAPVFKLSSLALGAAPAPAPKPNNQQEVSSPAPAQAKSYITITISSTDSDSVDSEHSFTVEQSESENRLCVHVPDKDEGTAEPEPHPSPSTIRRIQSRYLEVADLAAYYYGETQTQPQGVRSHLRREASVPKKKGEMDIHVQCSACPKIFTNNHEIIRHFYEHIEKTKDEELVVKEKQKPLRDSSLRCNICLRKTTLGTLNRHLKMIHELKDYEFPCRICELFFHTKSILVNHMHRTHPCLDMPYSCEICGFRTSFRTKLFSHFYENHISNHVLCNFCLAAIPVESAEDMKFLERHLLQHITNPKIKCKHCALRFVSIEDLKSHLKQNHIRHPTNSSILDFQLYKRPKTEVPLMMWLPSSKTPKMYMVSDSTAKELVVFSREEKTDKSITHRGVKRKFCGAETVPLLEISTAKLNFVTALGLRQTIPCTSQ